MLKGIPRVISPELLKILSEMGHGDEIVIADGNFPSVRCGQRVVSAAGSGCYEMLEAVLRLIPLDTYAGENFLLMQTVQGDAAPQIWELYMEAAKADAHAKIGLLERFSFYERAKNAFAVVATGETQTLSLIHISEPTRP